MKTLVAILLGFVCLASSEKPRYRFVMADSACEPSVPFDNSSCCEHGFTYIDLKKNAPCTGINTAPGIQIIDSPTDQSTSEVCSKMALLKVTFERFNNKACDYCIRSPLCGRRMLRLDLKLSSGTRSGFSFNIGDSNTNNGWDGDASTSENDAEAEGMAPNVRVWAGDKCGSQTSTNLVFQNAIDAAVKDVTIYISNGYIRVVNDQGFDDYFCDKCLYALNGQSDNQGPINEDIYIGLNRVVAGTYRSGVGVCSATLSWSCPHW